MQTSQRRLVLVVIGLTLLMQFVADMNQLKVRAAQTPELSG